MAKFISGTKLSATLNLTEQNDGFWLWDETRKMNLSMRAKSSTEALVEALTYYQNRLTEAETNYASLKNKVDSFVGQVVESEEN